MITAIELTTKLRSYPEAIRLFDRMADSPLPDAAYFLLLYGLRLDDIQYRAGLLSPPFIENPSAEPVPQTYIGKRSPVARFDRNELMLARLGAVHPEATNANLLDAVAAANRLNDTAGSVAKIMEADMAGMRFVAYLSQECPGFEQRSYELAYHDFRVANR